jgi:hypothetical protein
MVFLFFIAYVALTYIQPGQIVPALAPYRVTFWVGIAGLVVAIVPLFGKRIGLVTNLQLLALVVFTVLMGVSLMIAERWPGAPVVVIQRFGPSFTIFVLALCSITSLARLRVAATGIIALTLTLTLQGAAAYHLGYKARLFLLDREFASEDQAAVDAGDDVDFEFVSVDDVASDSEDTEEPLEPRRIRALGFMKDPNDLAMGLIVALGLIGGAWTQQQRFRNVLLAAAAGALVYGVFLTRSRGGAVALVVVIWRTAARRIGEVPALALLIALSAGAMAFDFGGRSISLELDQSASERVVAWTEGLEMLKAQPLLGVGYGQFVDHHTLTAHNSLVLCFAETGLLGCFFWVGLFVVTLLELQALKRLPGDKPFDQMVRRWAEGLQLSVIGFLAAAFFLSRTFVPTLYLIVGLAAALAVIVRNAERPIRLPALPALAMLVLACELGGICVVYAIVKLHIV